MHLFQKRVMLEKQELDARIKKLSEFNRTELYRKLDGDEQGRLSRQLHAMRSYSEVLGERIVHFKP